MPLFLIFLLYVIIGLLAGGGAVALSSRRFPGKAEPVFYGVLLVPIAGMYLAFGAHFGAEEARGLELGGALLLAGLGLAGIRWPAFLILAYVGHGA